MFGQAHGVTPGLSCAGTGDGLKDSCGLLPTQIILWFCGYPKQRGPVCDSAANLLHFLWTEYLLQLSFQGKQLGQGYLQKFHLTVLSLAQCGRSFGFHTLFSLRSSSCLSCSLILNGGLCSSLILISIWLFHKDFPFTPFLKITYPTDSSLLGYSSRYSYPWKNWERKGKN